MNGPPSALRDREGTGAGWRGRWWSRATGCRGAGVLWHTAPIRGGAQRALGVGAWLIERGSPITHVAIVAGNWGLPTVVQSKMSPKRIRTSMRIRVDGAKRNGYVLSEG